MRHRLPILLLAVTGSVGASATLAFAPVDVQPAAALPAPPTNTWKAVSASGLVEAWPASRPTEAWVHVERGDELVARTAVRTGRRGRTTLIHGASIVLVDPNSHISLPASAALADTDKVVQEYGSVLYDVDGASNPDFHVVTPHLVAGVKGTVFLVSVTETRATVSVREGVVEVTAQGSGRMQEVHAGETILVDAEHDEAMALVARDERPRGTGVDDRREAVRTARLEERRFDRALNRLAADLSDAGLDRDELAGFGGDEIARFLHGRTDGTETLDTLAERYTIVIQVGDLDDGTTEELILDLDNEERKTLEGQEADPGQVAAPNQPLP